MPKLWLNAQALRFLDFLARNTITAKIGDTEVTLPHPANFALHKLLILSRRPTPEKQGKDKEAATRIRQALIDKGEGDLLRTVFNTMPRKWQVKVQRQLADTLDRAILDVLQRQWR